MARDADIMVLRQSVLPVVFMAASTNSEPASTSRYQSLKRAVSDALWGSVEDKHVEVLNEYTGLSQEDYQKELERTVEEAEEYGHVIVPHGSYGDEIASYIEDHAPGVDIERYGEPDEQLERIHRVQGASTEVSYTEKKKEFPNYTSPFSAVRSQERKDKEIREYRAGSPFAPINWISAGIRMSEDKTDFAVPSDYRSNNPPFADMDFVDVDTDQNTTSDEYESGPADISDIDVSEPSPVTDSEDYDSGQNPPTEETADTYEQDRDEEHDSDTVLDLSELIGSDSAPDTGSADNPVNPDVPTDTEDSYESNNPQDQAVSTRDIFDDTSDDEYDTDNSDPTENDHPSKNQGSDYHETSEQDEYHLGMDPDEYDGDVVDAFMSTGFNEFAKVRTEDGDVKYLKNGEETSQQAYAAANASRAPEKLPPSAREPGEQDRDEVYTAAGTEWVRERDEDGRIQVYENGVPKIDYSEDEDIVETQTEKAERAFRTAESRHALPVADETTKGYDEDTSDDDAYESEKIVTSAGKEWEKTRDEDGRIQVYENGVPKIDYGEDAETVDKQRNQAEKAFNTASQHAMPEYEEPADEDNNSGEREFIIEEFYTSGGKEWRKEEDEEGRVQVYENGVPRIDYGEDDDIVAKQKKSAMNAFNAASQHAMPEYEDDEHEEVYTAAGKEWVRERDEDGRIQVYENGVPKIDYSEDDEVVAEQTDRAERAFRTAKSQHALPVYEDERSAHENTAEGPVEMNVPSDYVEQLRGDLTTSYQTATQLAEELPLTEEQDQQDTALIDRLRALSDAGEAAVVITDSAREDELEEMLTAEGIRYSAKDAI